MTQIIPTDVYDREGNLLRIEYHNLEGDFEIQAEWNPQDEQTSENRENFRKWATTMVKRLNYEVKT